MVAATIDHASMPAVAEVIGASKRFGATRALRDVSLAVQPGETHALVGRNGAGKSTLVGVLTGIVKLDSGLVRFGGKDAPDNIAAHPELVSCLYQHSMLVPNMTVAENLFINRFNASGSRTVRWSALNAEAAALLSDWEIDVDPRASVSDITVAQRQLVEMTRALSQGANLIILDEPTAQLDGAQIEQLFAAIKRSRRRGASFLYISHFLAELFEICDTVTVLRDGVAQLAAPVSALTEPEIVDAMVGEVGPVRSATGRRAAGASSGETMVEIRDLALDGEFAPFDLKLRRGEILGIAGGARSGATAIGEVLAGLCRPSSGSVSIDGEPVPLGRVEPILEAGISYVPHERQVNGFIPQLSIAENITMSANGRLGRCGFIRPSKRAELADELIERFAIAALDRDAEVGNLSGGNQQKVVVGRAVSTLPRLVILDTPTAGVDVAAAATILDAVRAMAGGGAAIVISNLISELRICNRIQVISDGAMTREFAAGWAEYDLVAAIEGVE